MKGERTRTATRTATRAGLLARLRRAAVGPRALDHVHRSGPHRAVDRSVVGRPGDGHRDPCADANAGRHAHRDAAQRPGRRRRSARHR